MGTFPSLLQKLFFSSWNDTITSETVQEGAHGHQHMVHLHYI